MLGDDEYTNFKNLLVITSPLVLTR